MLGILKKSLVKNLGIYTFLNLINSAIPFLLLPILTKYLSPHDYGIVDMFTNLNFILLPILGLNLGSSIIRFYFYENIDFKKTVSVVISYILFFGVISFLIVGGLYLMNFDPFGGSIPKYIILFTVIYVVFSQLIDVLLNIWRVEEKAFYYGLLRITKTLFDLGLSVYCLLILNLGWEGRVFPILIVTIIIGLSSLFLINKKIKLKFNFDKKIIKRILTYTFPLIFHSLGAYLISFSDRFLILYFIDAEEVGLYSVAYQIGMIMSFITNSFNQAYSPFLFSKLKANDNFFTLHRIKMINRYYFVLMLVLASIIYLTVPIIYKVFINKSFYVSHEIVFWVLLGYAFNGMYKIIVNFLFYFDKTKSLAYITMFSALVNFVFCLVLIPKIGILGASISTTIAFFTMFILVYIKYKKLDFIMKKK